MSNDSDTTCRLNEIILDSNDVIVRPNCDGGWQGIRGQGLPRVQGTGDVLLALRNVSSTTLGAYPAPANMDDTRAARDNVATSGATLSHQDVLTWIPTTFSVTFAPERGS